MSRPIYYGSSGEITDGSPPVVIAEAGQCMEGSVDRAIEMAAAAAAAGAFGFKVQLLTPDRIVAPFTPKYWGHGDSADQRKVFARNGVVDYGAWGAVAEACAEFGIEFLGTPFDEAAVEALAQISEIIKIASGDITNVRLLDAVAATGKAVILSTGASTLSEVAWAHNRLCARGASGVCLLACSLEYPTPAVHASLGRIGTLRSEFGCPVGYSDHTLGVWAAAPAAALGACVLEKHYSLGGSLPVPDHEMAVDDVELASYVEGALSGWHAIQISGLSPHPGEAAAATGARRSWYAVESIARGTPLTSAIVASLRPFRPDAANASVDIIGRTSCRDLVAGAPIRPSDFK